jgi:hypothetical protein
MQKISSQDASALLKQAGTSIRQLVEENQGLKQKLADQERDRRVVKLAQEMDEKGLNSELSLSEKVAHLRKVPNLEVTEQAVKLAAVQGNVLGDVDDSEPGNAVHPFETFIETGEDVR